MYPTYENFLHSPLSEAHRCDKCTRVGYIIYYEASQIQNINRMSGEELSTVSDLLPLTYWYWYRNDSVGEAPTTGIALICNKFSLLLCDTFNDTLTSLTYFLFLSGQSVFYTPFHEKWSRVVTFL